MHTDISNLRIAFLIPCLNEEQTIGKVIGDINTHLPEARVYVFDNNSDDNTGQVALDMGANVYRVHRRGKANVVKQMLRKVDADIYVMVDGDDTYPIHNCRQMIETLINKDADMVVGDRISNLSYSKENKRPFHGFGNGLVRSLINMLFNARLKDILSGYRVLSKDFVNSYYPMVQGFEIETEMTVFALHHDLTIEEYPIHYKDRPEGSHSKLNTYQDGYRILRSIFNFFRYYKPLTFFGLLALLFFITGIAVGIPPILEFIRFQYVYKVPSAVLAASLIILSFLSFSCGLILDAIIMIDKKNFRRG